MWRYGEDEFSDSAVGPGIGVFESSVGDGEFEGLGGAHVVVIKDGGVASGVAVAVAAEGWRHDGSGGEFVEAEAMKGVGVEPGWQVPPAECEERAEEGAESRGAIGWPDGGG